MKNSFHLGHWSDPESEQFQLYQYREARQGVFDITAGSA